VSTKYLYEGDKVVLETDGNNNETAYQVYGTNLLYRSVAGNEEMSGQEYYYLYNAHGDVTSLVDALGNIAVTYDYDAFGNIINETGEANNNIKYAGYQYDDESGLYYLNARYYDNDSARFITEDDPKYSNNNDPLSLNLYTYCNNNPITYDDPSGHNAVPFPAELPLPYAPSGSDAANLKDFLSDIGKGILWYFHVEIGAEEGKRSNTIPYPAPVNPNHKSTTNVTSNNNATVNTKSYKNPAPGNPPKQVESKSKTKETYNPDPYARPGQKQQGREKKNKNRKKEDFKPNPNKKQKPQPKHTPGKDHRKYFKER
jgi:RHS repeat-associated protein